MSHPASRTGTRRYAYRGRHRAATGTTSTAVRSAVLSAGVLAALMVGAAAPASAAPSADAWYRLRVCESGNNYQTNTGNGYYGAYQFDLGTWQSVGGSGLPSNASPAEQDYRARLLYQARGWAPWGCARILGLTADPSYGQTAAPPTTRQSGVVSSTTATVRPRAASTIAGPRALRLGTQYRIIGKTGPHATVVLYFRGTGEQSFTAKRRLRADRLGRWSTSWRAVTDFQYYASGGVHSRVVATKVLPSAAAPTVTRLVSGPSPVTVTGTARPGSVLVVYVRASGSTRFVPAARVRVTGDGRYLTSFVSPGGLFDCLITSSNGLRSRPWHGLAFASWSGTMAE